MIKTDKTMLAYFYSKDGISKQLLILNINLCVREIAYSYKKKINSKI